MSDTVNPKISVIIPVYNQERYVSQCLDSILAQTMGEFEAICIDDGSTDNSGPVLDGYAQRDSRIRVVHRENKGVGPTRNEALRLAKGEFVAFMDPDDYYPDDKVFERLYSAARDSGALVCGGSLAVWDEEHARLVEKRLFPDKFDKDGFMDYCDFQFDYGYQRYIYSRAMLERAGAEFPPYKRFQDPPFFVKAMIAAGRFYRICPVTYVYRWSRRFSNWDDERVLHLVSAIRDNLSVAAENKLYDLFGRTLARVKVDFRNEIATHRTEEVDRVMDEIMALSLKVSRDTIPSLPDGKPPKVSVVLPVYNAEKFLRQCLDSLKAQTLKDMEFLCVNDGSTDKSLAIIREYQKGDPRFIAIDKPNSGYGHAVNCGLALASGDYVGIVEPDDYVKPEMFGELYDCAERNKVDFVKSGIIHCWAGKPDTVVHVCDDMSVVGRVVDPRYEQRVFTALMNNVTGIYRRTFLVANHVRLNETPGAAYQDNGFYLQVHYAATRIFLLDKAYYYYRQDNESSSCNSRGKAFAIFDEFKMNDAILADKGKKRRIFLGHYIYKKFKSYKFHLSRIAPEFKLEFLRRFADEFAVHERNGEINWDVMSPAHRAILRSILDDYTAYYKKCMEATKTVRATPTAAGDANHPAARQHSGMEVLKRFVKMEDELGEDAIDGAFVYRKFKNYNAELKKVDWRHLEKFLEEVSRQFNEHLRRGQLDWSIMSKGHVGVLRAILDDPLGFARKLKFARVMEDLRAAQAENREWRRIFSDVLKLGGGGAAAGLKSAQLAREGALLRREIASLQTSESYRLGLFLTWPLRKIYRLLRGKRQAVRT